MPRESKSNGQTTRDIASNAVPEAGSSSISVQRGKFCVYTHSIAGKVFYVGQGALTRPFSLGKGLRNYMWDEIAQTGQSIEVAIVEWHLTRREARNAETKLIRELRPKANYPKPLRPRAKSIGSQKAKRALRALLATAISVNETIQSGVTPYGITALYTEKQVGDLKKRMILESR
jgi:hypothetical protein